MVKLKNCAVGGGSSHYEAPSIVEVSLENESCILAASDPSIRDWINGGYDTPDD